MGIVYGDFVWGFQLGILNGDFKWGFSMVCGILNGDLIGDFIW